MDILNLEYVAKTAQKKYERDLKSCTYFGKVQPRKLALKIMEINDRLGDGHGGLLGHNLDKLKTLEGLPNKEKELFEQCLILALAMQSLVIYGRSQNYPMRRNLMALVEDSLGRDYFTQDTDPARYINIMTGQMAPGLDAESLSGRFLRFSRDIVVPHDGALYGLLHPAFEFAFDRYLVKDDFNAGIKKELGDFFRQKVLESWESRKGDIPVVIRYGEIAPKV